MIDADDLPDGWAVATLGEVTEPKVQQGGPSDSSPTFTYIDITGVDNGRKAITDPKALAVKEAPSRARQHVRPGDVLVSMTRPNLNAVAVVPENLAGSIASTGFHVLRPKEVLPEWLFMMVRSTAFVAAMSELVQGALYPAVRPSDIRDYTIPIPPLAEQRRIVAKVEELTARCRAARAALAEVPTLLEQFRQSVLASAFRGDLTADWRAKNPNAEPASVLLDRIRAELSRTRKPGRASRAAAAEAEVILHDEDTLPEKWRAVRLRDVLTLQPGYAFSSKDFTTGGVRLLRGTNIIPNGTRWDDVVCLPADKATSYREYELHLGDIVFAMDRPIISTGIKVARLTDYDLPALLLQRVGRFRLSSGVEPRFLYAYLQSDLFRQHIDTRETGTQLPHVSGNDIEAAPFVLPPLAEQEEISRFLDAATTNINIVIQSLHYATADLDALDQSILAKAFRGELVSQDPADEPAAALLARIRSGVSATRSVERGRVKFYILLLLRTWNKPLSREMLERGLVLMLNADVRRAILGRSKPAPKRGKKPDTPPRFVTGLDLFLGEMLDDGDLVSGPEAGFFAEGQHGIDFAAAPKADLDAVRETAEAMKVIHKDKLQATDADIVSALNGEIYELVS